MSAWQWTICVVTGSRAEYGLLYWVMKEMEADKRFRLQIVATGMHLSPEFGQTVKRIVKNGFRVNRKLEILLSSDSAVGVAKAVGLGAIGFADAYSELRPDAVLVLGDRFELLAAAATAHLLRIPIVHIAGGDLTEAAFDDAIRHAITKMAHVHFVTNEESRHRVLQMGENPALVFNHGSPGLDCIRKIKRLTRKQLELKLNFRLHKRNLLITFHPVTLSERGSAKEFGEVLQALDRLGPEFGLIFTKPNADVEGRRLIAMIEDFVHGHKNARAYTSLGQELYLSALGHVDAVVGNSSSGLYEAPSFKIPTINVGDRQAGRLRASSVIDCASNAQSIYRAIQRGLRLNCARTVNPYGDGRSARRIVRTLARCLRNLHTTRKTFFTVPRRG